MLEKVRDLRLEEATDTALTLKWDPVKVVSTQTYRLEIRLAAGAISFVNFLSWIPAKQILAKGHFMALSPSLKEGEVKEDLIRSRFEEYKRILAKDKCENA